MTRYASLRARVRGVRRTRALLLVVAVAAFPAGALAQSAALTGTGGDDTITGTTGDDTIFALAGNDTIDGAAGDDDLDGGSGTNDIHGGPGIDAVVYGDRSAAVAVTLDNVANDGPTGSDNVHDDVEQIYGGQAGDRLTGNTKDNLVDGAGGDDSITDGGGTDRVYGGAGDDVITTFDGSIDVVDCGAGNDTVTSDRNDTLVDCEKRLPPKTVRSPIAFEFAYNGARTTVKKLIVTDIPAGGRVEVRCHGPGCAFASTKLPAGKKTASLAALFRGRSLRAPKATIEVRITQPEAIGKVLRFRTRVGAIPSTSALCLPPAATSAQKQC